MTQPESSASRLSASYWGMNTTLAATTKWCNMEISKKEMKILLKSQQGELDAVLMYNALAKVAKIKKDKETFRQLAREEGHHASVFHKLTQRELTPKHTKEILLPILYKIFPRWILYPAIAQGEYAAVKTYAPVAEKFPEGMFRFEKRIER